MADHTSNAVGAAIRAMNELIIPAIDRSDPLALEQATIVAGLLEMIESRIDYVADRNRFEARHYLGVGRRVLPSALIVSKRIGQELRDAIDHADSMLRSPDSTVSDIRSCTATLAGTITALVRASSSAGADVSARHTIETTILIDSKELLDAQRSWFLPQGWEKDSTKVPSIENAFR